MHQPATHDKSAIKLSTNVTLKKYLELLNEQEKSKVKIAEFVHERLTERYITPMLHVPKDYKNGFSIMANCCLLIETYQCFQLGLKDTVARGKGKEVFRDFFNDEPLFTAFTDMGESFYDSVRCGILHQGETKNGWTITRNSSASLFDKSQLRINANRFIIKLKDTLDNYKVKLIVEDWSTPIWINCRQKIEHIKNNCYYRK